ncbi:MAG: DEAD/DEAH box helicase family protein [Candidatus Riflebacteria bacterium]
MVRCKEAPELTFQEHIRKFLVNQHGYGVLEQSDISDTENAIAEDMLWAFLQATQAETLQKLAADYGSDAREEIFRALRKELMHTPLWLLLRHGLKVRGHEIRLFYPQPRSQESSATDRFLQNRITFRPHFYFGEKHQEIDFVFFLNGLPIVAMEVKHEKNQNVHDAVAQFAARDHSQKIFQHPFMYLAADTSDAMVATDPQKIENFRWYNMGLTNRPINDAEYPVEFIYREVLSPAHLFEMLSFFLIRVPHQAAEENRPARQAFTILPRYHQSRMVRKVAEDALKHFASSNSIGKKYLINHSAGSGKTLSICWLADRIHSLYNPGTSDKLVDMVFILTDRKSLDKNIRDEIENFRHLTENRVLGLARKADDLPAFLRDRRPIVVTTQQKFAWILEEIEKRPELKKLRVAFLIDEAHRSQEGRMGVAIRVPFREATEPDLVDAEDDEKDEEERISQIIREHDSNQLFVAFTATPAPATVDLFGSAFDTYSEAEAIAEGYIVDVAAAIISYKTLYNLHCPVILKVDEEKTYPKGVVAKALQNVAFQDEGLIQYKAEVMLRIFEKDIMSLINGRAKAMIVTTSRLAGLQYYRIIKEKLKERGAAYKVLYAFSDFVHPVTNAAISEHALNDLNDGELIEDRFENEDHRLMIVASKFQTGFDQPLLAGMFLDKVVSGRNAVQTVSRLNRCHNGKKEVVVVDFTNNASAILKAFTKFRKGTPFEPDEPDPQLCYQLLEKIFMADVFNHSDVQTFLKTVNENSDTQLQYLISSWRNRFQEKLVTFDERKSYVYLLSRLVKSFHFLSCFFSYPAELTAFVKFAEYVGPQLIKQGNISDLMKQIRQTEVVKATVSFIGEVRASGGEIKLKPSPRKKGCAPTPRKVSVQEMIDEIRKNFKISDEEALYIKEVTKEKIEDQEIRQTVLNHQDDQMFLEGAYRSQVHGEIKVTYTNLGRYDELADRKYTDKGGIFDLMAVTVIETHLQAA